MVENNHPHQYFKEGSNKYGDSQGLASVVKNPPANAEDVGLIPELGRFPWRRKWQPTPVFFLGKSHGQRSLAGC